MLSSSSASGADASAQGGHSLLLCRVGALVCGLPLEQVSETLRPLAVQPLPGVPAFMDGVSIIRGAPVPVVDLARLLGDASVARRTRLVVVRVDQRSVAFAVEQVMGVRAVAVSSLGALPPLLREASADFVSAVGALDARLLVVLESFRELPASLWASPAPEDGEA